ncbi:DUF1515 domain-containing protein [Rhizobium sp. GCM10022189]|uniref:DUF1515 domain-containing protein n=1 Tax=Rhizobium sp. GCM10022189 TaxID=3252654 RepID=UPI00361733BB
MRALGNIEAKLDAVADRQDRADSLFAVEQQQAHHSRAAIHKRLDQQQQQISRMETTVAISGQVDAQLRDSIAVLKQTVMTDISPTIDEWKRIKFLGGVLSGALVALGVTAATAVAWLYDWLAIVLRYLSKGH